MINFRSLPALFRAAMKLAAACAFVTAIAAAVSAQTNTFPENGNAGIGTTAPTAPLEIKAAASSHSSVLLNTTSTGYAGSFIFQEAGTTKASIQHNPGVLPGALLFNTNGGSSPANTRMVISAAGNVGIGTTSPQTRFDIKQSSDTFVGGLHLRRSSTNDTWALVTGADNSLYMGYANNASGADAVNDFTVYPLVLTSAGKVGIGTANPDSYAKLHLYSSGGFGQDIQTSTNDWTRFRFVTPTRTWGFLLDGGSAALGAGKFGLYDYTANAWRLVADTNGNLGIGTTTPTYKLDVQGGQINSSGGLCIAGDCRTAWSQVGGGGGSVSSVFGRTGAVVAATNDYTWAQINKSAANAGDLATGTLLAARMPALTGDVTTSVGTVATTLSNTGVSAGSYTNANITVDAKGRITAASNGSGGATAFSDITAGTNTLPLVVGNGGSLGVSGTGTINATSLTSAANITSGTVPIARLGTGTPDSTKFLRGDNTWTAITSSQWTTGTGNISYTAGNVGIGVTPNSSYKLDVAGNINSSGTITGNIINAKYQDLAEWVPSSEQLSAGTVVVLDTTKSNQVISSGTAYDTRVAGVISAQPGITLGEGGEGKVLVATTGRVRVKVDASRGAIQIGDLLVTSDVAGLAMKSAAINFGGVHIHRPGTIIGKALEPLAKGSGEILVLLSLQ